MKVRIEFDVNKEIDGKHGAPLTTARIYHDDVLQEMVQAVNICIDGDCPWVEYKMKTLVKVDGIDNYQKQVKYIAEALSQRELVYPPTVLKVERREEIEAKVEDEFKLIDLTKE